MAKHVKGTLFLDYVRMLRKRKQVDWSKYLNQEDMELLNQMILPSNWYPLETYQRMGVAVLHEISKGDNEMARAWGRGAMDELVGIYKTLVKPGQPLDSMKKFQVLRSRFFDFEGLEVVPKEDKRVHVIVDVAFGGVADEAYAFQMLGSFERLLELSGAKNIQFEIIKKAWEGEPNSVLDISWE